MGFIFNGDSPYTFVYFFFLLDNTWMKKLIEVTGVWKIMPDSKVMNIFWILTANIINKPQAGYCVRIVPYTRTILSGWARFPSRPYWRLQRKLWKPMKIKGSGNIFWTPCTLSIWPRDKSELIVIDTWENSSDEFWNGTSLLICMAIKKLPHWLIEKLSHSSTSFKSTFNFSCMPGEDIEGLLFHFLDEWLYIFSAEDFFIPR